MSTEIAKPWALMRRHAGRADFSRVQAEAGGHATGLCPDRESDERVTPNTCAVLAWFATQEGDGQGPGARSRRTAQARRRGLSLRW
jgi:hypothetical protein